MGKLTCIKPALRTIKPALGQPTTQGAGWANTSRASRHQRGYGWVWEQAVARIRARDCDLCQECLRKNSPRLGTYAAVDHKLPRSQGGSDDDINLEVICREHHDAKTARESGAGRRGY